jgi:hypothetical protein
MPNDKLKIVRKFFKILKIFPAKLLETVCTAVRFRPAPHPPQGMKKAVSVEFQR